MDRKSKLTLIIGGIIETIILIFCLTVSIIVLTTLTDPDKFPLNHQELNIQNNGQFIGTLQNNSVLFFCCFVLPLFIIFLIDVTYLIIYANKRESTVSDQERKDIEIAAKEQARLELLKELEEENKSDK